MTFGAGFFFFTSQVEFDLVGTGLYWVGSDILFQPRRAAESTPPKQHEEDGDELIGEEGKI